MSALQTLRQTKTLARLVLAWFALFVAVAVAAPVVSPQASALVCSAQGDVRLVNLGTGDAVPSSVHTLDCVLCLSVYAPPPSVLSWGARPVAGTVYVPQMAQALVPFRSDAHLAARAPPALI
jgi:hypothetical protein